jgi:hypothetical protein
MDIQLSLADCRRLDKEMIRGYDTWVTNAPLAYKADGFLAQRVPITVTSRYGQNQDLGMNPANAAETSRNWGRDRDFGRLRYMTIALATHVRYVHNYTPRRTLSDYPSAREVAGWRDRPTDDYEELYADGIYDSADENERRLINVDELLDLPLLDEGLHEIPIYTQSGYQIQRRIARFRASQRPHGILMDLRRLHELFEAEEDDLFEIVDDMGSVNYTVYPQAGLRTVGHYQADGLPTKLRPHLRQVNTAVGIQLDTESDNSYDEEELERSPHQPVTGIASQGYNAVMHSTRGRSNQHHDAQLGLITGTLAGAWAVGDKAERKARNLLTKCSKELPHISFGEKIKNAGIKRDLRLEHVYSIDIHAISSIHRTGE